MSIAATARDRRCPGCGGRRDASLPDGLCARCLLAFALEAEPATHEDNLPASAGARIAPAFIHGNIGRYRLVAEIDRGGVGIVYRAWQDDLGREVALKMLLPERLETKDARDRFRREAELMAGLDHPGILPVYEVGEHEGLPYYSMKLAERGNLAQRVPALRGRYGEIARLLAAIARAVGHGHGRGVLHRDLKPSNIVFDASGQCMVTDFGLARRIAVDSTLTGIDVLIGTPRYVAPEVVTTAGARLTATADVYGLGAILYELLTGQAPFAELTPLQILQQIATRRPLPPRRLDASIPAALETICLRCLEKRPGDRYASANAFADALEDWQGDTPPHAGHWAGQLARRTLPSRRRIWAWGTLAALVVGAIAVTFVLARRGEFSSTPDARIATRTLVVLPVGLPTPPASELAAARALSVRLQGIRSLTVAPIEPALKRAQAGNFPSSALESGMALSALVQVQVAAADASPQPQLHVRAVDVLRGEQLWEGQAASLADIGGTASELGVALDKRTHTPPPEAGLSRPVLAAIARGTELLTHDENSANDAAIEAFQQAIAIEPKSALAHAQLSHAYSHRSFRFGGPAFWIDSAIEEAELAARLDPTLPDAAAALGYAYYIKGWWQRSIAANEQARARGADGLDNNLAFSHYGLALAYYGVGRFEESFQLYRHSLQFAPHSRITTSLAAQVLLTLGATEAGEHWMQAADALEPDAAIRTKRNEISAAEFALYRGDYGRCRALVPTLDPDLFSDGMLSVSTIERSCAYRQHDWAALLAMLQSAMKAAETGNGNGVGNSIHALEQAIVLEQLGRHAEAVPMLVKAHHSAQISIDSGREYPVIWLRMAAVLRLEGDIDAAYRMLDSAFAHGLTIDARSESYIEFQPFQNDARFAELRTASRAKVAAMRERVLATLPADDAKAAPAGVAPP